MTEKWRAVAGYEGLYEISSEGRVRGLDRLDGAGRRWKGRMLKLGSHEDGYPQARLSRSGAVETFLVHRLVLTTFVGPCPEGMEARHINSNPTESTLANLEWSTKSTNNLDRVARLSHHNSAKTHCPRDHRLVAPNLALGALKRGRRNCLACKRAREFARRAGVDFTPDLANLFYSRISAGISRKRLDLAR